MAYNGQEIFKRLGILIKWHNELGTQANSLDAIYSTAITRYGANADDRADVTRIGALVSAHQAQLRQMQDEVVGLVTEYIGGNLKRTLNSPYNGVKEILDDLIEAMREASPPDFINGNAVSASTPAKDADNRRSDGTSTTVTVNSLARNANFFEVVCVDDGRIDAEVWEVRSSLTGDAPANLVTGEDFAWTAAGIDSFKINAMPIKESGDTSNQLAGWELAGLVRGVNTSEDGKLWSELKKTPTSITETGDENAQLASWSLSGAKLTNTDDGKLYVAAVREPADYTMSGDVDVTLSAWSLTGASYVTNTDPDGKLFFDVTLSGSTYTVSVYKDPQKANKVAEGSNTGPLPKTITLTQQNSSGLSGSVRLDAHAADERGIVLSVPYHYVRLYNSPLRGAAPVMAQGVSFAASATGLTLSEKNSSGLSGSVNLAYGEDDNDTELLVPLHFVKLYRADIAGLSEDAKAALLVAIGASAAATASDVALVGRNGSGISGTVDVTWSADTSSVLLETGWKAGDKWTFSTTSDEVGKFLEFLRNRFTSDVPDKTDGSETILDSLAA